MKLLIALTIFLMSAPLNAHDYDNDELQRQINKDRRDQASYQRDLKESQWRQDYKLNRIRENQILMQGQRFIDRNR
jgi:hypothetical protein